MQLETLSREQLVALVAKMQQDKQRGVSFKVTVSKIDPETGKRKGTDGAISMYGLGRFPVTLFQSQWRRVIEAIESGSLQRFMDGNRDKLSVKDE